MDIEENNQQDITRPRFYEIIVKGLPFAASEHDLTDYFGECGAIAGVNLLKGPEGRSKGIAFIRFETQAGQESAVGKNGSEFGGRSLSIQTSSGVFHS